MNSTVLYILIGYILLLVIVYFVQEKFIFKPEKLRQDFKYKYDAPFKELFFDVKPGVRINGLHFTTKDPLGLILYFHGNSRSIKGWAKYAGDFFRYNYDVVLVDYRGFGKSTGTLSEQNLYTLALFVQKLAIAKYPGDSIIIYGKSLGTGIASFLATECKDKMLILETPYYSIPDVFSAHTFIYPTGKMINYKMPNNTFLDNVKIPVMIFHGTSDWIIPYHCAAKLKAHLKNGDKFFTITGADHHDINQKVVYYRALDSLLTL